MTRRTAGALIDAGLDWLHVSVDGATAATYESIRDGARFDRVAAHVRGLVEELRVRGAVRPVVQIVFVAQRSNVAELPAMVRLVASWGVAELRVQNLAHDFSDTDPAGAYRAIRDYTAGQALWEGDESDGPAVAAVLAEARRVAAEEGVALRLPDSEAAPAPARGPDQPGCDWPWRSTYVMHDGTVQPCCMVMGADRATLGHADSGLAAAWSGAAAVDFRTKLLSDTPPDVCRGCAFYRRTF